MVILDMKINDHVFIDCMMVKQKEHTRILTNTKVYFFDKVTL